MSIYTDQNTTKKLQLLSAYSMLYLYAKRIMGIRTIISILVTSVGTLVALIIPNSIVLVASIGAIWALISEIFLKTIEKREIREGAIIQEEFDTDLFKIPWNLNLVGSKITPELIISADREFKGDRSKLKNWYPNTGNTTRPLDILLCQRSCIVWDWRLRGIYITAVAVASIGWFAIEVIIAIALNLSLLNFFLTLFLPSSALYLIAFDIIKDNYELLGLRQKLDNKVAKLLSSNRNNSVTIKKCRDIQDDLFRLRSKGALIPNWFYSIFRNKFEIDMKKATKTLIKRS